MAPPAETSPTSRTLSLQIQRRTFPPSAFRLNVELTAQPGFTILFGPSGSGKTTLLNCISGLATPDDGRIVAGDRVLFDAQAHINPSVARRRVGYVLQDLALFPHLTVQRNVEYGLAHLSQAARTQAADSILDGFQILQLRHRRPSEISGGERQRVALARSLVIDPCVLLLDEPLAALDSVTKSKILDDLRRWNEAHQIPIIYVTHSREEVLALGENVLVMEEGRIIARGTPHEVLSAPLQETVAQLAGFENIFDATVASVHEDRGTMTCVLRGGKAAVLLETPLIRAKPGATLRIGIRAGDILLATEKPVGLSARNIIAGEIVSLTRRDAAFAVRVDCGVEMQVHITLAARDSLNLAEGRGLWLVIKTYSCHLMQK